MMIYVIYGSSYTKYTGYQQTMDSDITAFHSHLIPMVAVYTQKNKIRLGEEMFQRLLLIFIIIMSFVVLTTTGVVVWSLRTYGGSLPTRIHAADTPPAWVAVTAAGELQYHHDGQTTVLRNDAVAQGYALPSIAPNGQQVLFVRQTTSIMAVAVISLVDGQMRDLYTSDSESPIGLQWSPNGRYVAFLLDSTGAAVVVPSDASSTALTIAHGSPIYMDWSPDSAALLLHIGGIGRDGGVVGIYDVTTQKVMQTYNDPADFQSPQWDAQGTGFYYVADPTPQADATIQPTAQIVHQMHNGTRTIIAEEGLATVRLLRAPLGNALAFIASRVDDRVLRVWDNGTLTTISNDAPLAAWWSPDARQIAMITVVDDQQLRWNVVTLANRQRRTLQAFMPSDMNSGYMRYFDAYRISPWSRDGKWLLTVTTTIIQAQVLDGGTMVPLGPGEFAVWAE